MPQKHYDQQVAKTGYYDQNGFHRTDYPVAPETAQSGLVAAGSLIVATLITIIVLIVVFHQQIAELVRYFLLGG